MKYWKKRFFGGGGGKIKIKYETKKKQKNNQTKQRENKSYISQDLRKKVKKYSLCSVIVLLWSMRVLSAIVQKRYLRPRA